MRALASKPAAAGQPTRPGARYAVREGLLLLGFLIVVAAAVFTVAVPELSKEPDEGAPSQGGATVKPK
ncbi:MAG: hypothetical protein ACHQ53_10180 [Polyangiales bacterium]